MNKHISIKKGIKMFMQKIVNFYKGWWESVKTQENFDNEDYYSDSAW